MPLPPELHLLVIEDNPDLIRNAMTFWQSFKKATRNVKLQVSYATTLAEALPLLPDIDGVMCDTFFPLDSGSFPQPHSVEVVTRCRALGKPIVLMCNSLDDQHFFDLQRELRDSIIWHMPVFGRNTNGLVRIEGYDPAPDWKPWNQALHGLLYLLAGLKCGATQFDSDGDIVPRKPFPEFTKNFPLAVLEAGLDYDQKWGKTFKNLSPHNLRQWASLFTSNVPQLQKERREDMEKDYLSQMLQSRLYPSSEEGRFYSERRALSGPLRELYLPTKPTPSTSSETQTQSVDEKAL